MEKTPITGKISREKRPKRHGICDFDGCDEYAYNWLCKAHGIAANLGRIPLKPEWGVQVNPECTVDGCTATANTRKPGAVCQTHHTRAIIENQKGEVRKKRRKHETLKTCQFDGCENVTTAKGLCSIHYEAKKRGGRRREPCAHEGCASGTVRTYCSLHLKDLADYGRTFDTGDKAARRRARNAQNPPCRVQGCDTRVPRKDSDLCKRHRVDASRKHCSLDFYLDLTARTTCESCGAADRRLVVDHDHACPHPENEMCESCIRGVLCGTCNVAFGMLQDDVNRVEALLAYARTHAK